MTRQMRHPMPVFCSLECYLLHKKSARRQKPCGRCGLSFGDMLSPAQFNRAKYCSQACSARRGINGTTTKYHQLKRDGKHIPEHRYIVEQRIGRKLLPTEQIHHVNEIKTDNRDHNLEGPLTPAEHRQRHRRYPDTKICIYCDAPFTPHKTKRKRQQTCFSPECRKKRRLDSLPRKVSIDDRATIRALRAAGLKLTEIGAMFDISFGTVSEICLQTRCYVNP